MPDINLFTPGRINGFETRNRMIMAPMTRSRANVGWVHRPSWPGGVARSAGVVDQPPKVDCSPFPNQWILNHHLVCGFAAATPPGQDLARRGDDSTGTYFRFGRSEYRTCSRNNPDAGAVQAATSSFASHFPESSFAKSASVISPFPTFTSAPTSLRTIRQMKCDASIRN